MAGWRPGDVGKYNVPARVRSPLLNDTLSVLRPTGGNGGVRCDGVATKAARSRLRPTCAEVIWMVTITVTTDPTRFRFHAPEPRGTSRQPSDLGTARPARRSGRRTRRGACG